MEGKMEKLTQERDALAQKVKDSESAISFSKDAIEAYKSQVRAALSVAGEARALGLRTCQRRCLPVLPTDLCLCSSSRRRRQRQRPPPRRSSTSMPRFPLRSYLLPAALTHAFQIVSLEEDLKKAPSAGASSKTEAELRLQLADVSAKLKMFLPLVLSKESALMRCVLVSWTRRRRTKTH